MKAVSTPRWWNCFVGSELLSKKQRVLYTTETYSGARVQKFVFKGEAPVQPTDQGVVWPSSRD